MSLGETGQYSYECTKPKKPAMVAVQVVQPPATQLGEQMLMVGVESGEFDTNQYSTTAGFNFLNDARSAGVALNAGQES